MFSEMDEKLSKEKAKTPAMPLAGVFFCYFLLSHHSKSTAMRATISGASNGSQTWTRKASIRESTPFLAKEALRL
ncbi:MAG: hypothetical protein IJV86_03610 [Clostridia bacterium]|nr:hypothetical protein [Clostridia bacterium]